MTKEQLIKEFEEKFRLYDTRKPIAFFRTESEEGSKRIIEHPENIKSFLLSAFDAGEKNGIAIGRASGIEEVKKKMERAVKKIEITEAEPPFYQKKVNAYATQEARKTVRNFMKYIFSPPPPVKITK